MSLNFVIVGRQLTFLYISSNSSSSSSISNMGNGSSGVTTLAEVSTRITIEAIKSSDQ